MVTSHEMICSFVKEMIWASTAFERGELVQDLLLLISELIFWHGYCSDPIVWDY